MNLNYKHLEMYLLAGIASGLLCHFSGIIDNEFLYFGTNTNLSPAIILGIMIFLVGRYASGIVSRSRWFDPLILIFACRIGWDLASDFGAEYWGGVWSLTGSGIIGGFFVGLGVVVGWWLKRVWTVIMLTTLTGGLGSGLVWVLGGFDWLFIIWQGILLLGIGITIQIDEIQSTVKS